MRLESKNFQNLEICEIILSWSHKYNYIGGTSSAAFSELFVFFLQYHGSSHVISNYLVASVTYYPINARLPDKTKTIVDQDSDFDFDLMLIVSASAAIGS